jgi:hypothetical protein
MEADWAAEIGPDFPSIDVPWEGFVDLRKSSFVIEAISEATLHPALSAALRALNTEDSPVFTSKCDRWIIADEALDPDEFDSSAEEAQIAVASYIDISQRDPIQLTSFDFHESWARQLTAALRTIPITQARIDLVLRPATVDQHCGFGMTLYAAGCGSNAAEAEAAWQAVLAAAIPATIKSASARASSSIG